MDSPVSHNPSVLRRLVNGPLPDNETAMTWRTSTSTFRCPALTSVAAAAGNTGCKCHAGPAARHRPRFLSLFPRQMTHQTCSVVKQSVKQWPVAPVLTPMQTVPNRVSAGEGRRLLVGDTGIEAKTSSA